MTGNQVLIREGDQVVYDVASDEVIRSLHISGTMSFAPDKDTLLNVGLIRIQPGDKVIEEGFDCDHVPDEKNRAAATKDAAQPGFSAICVCCESKAALLVGTPEQPIDAAHTAKIRLHYIDGMDAKSMPAIVCCGGRMDFHGAPMSRTWVKLGENVNTRINVSGDGKRVVNPDAVVLAEPVTGWRVGDRIIVTKTGRPNYGKETTEEAVIKSIDGARITLEAPLKYEHLGDGEFRGEVANLSRNVIVESATPDGVRGHTMYHLGSAGSVSYAEFRHLGKRGVLGRYSIHFHLVRDTMRGSSILGASIHHSHNRWITVHGTDYLVVRDTVGYKSIGHGFFLEDGTEVYNTFDRNLACQALEGLPLPKQLLPFDRNDGAGFWFANAHNTFTNNVAVECRQYGYRYEATPRAGIIGTNSALNRKLKFGDPKALFNLALKVRQPDGRYESTDIRTLPFVRFENNETHSNGFWGLNMGLGVHGVGPDPSDPYVIRNLKIWAVGGGMGIESPHVLMDGVTIHGATYGVRGSSFVAQDWRNVTIEARGHLVSNLDEYLAAGEATGNNGRARQPGWPAGKGDGGASVQSPKIEVLKLNPIDKLPPITVITGVRRLSSGGLQVRGSTSDNGGIRSVTVNGRQAKELSTNFDQWEVELPAAKSILQLTAKSIDGAGNAEQTPHVMTVVVD